MYPHERSLALKYKNRPFGRILGVNSDTNRDRIKETIASAKTSPGAPGGREAATGAIPQLYHVERWPTLYLLDGRGTIRFAQIHDQALDEAIEFLLKELESGKV